MNEESIYDTISFGSNKTNKNNDNEIRKKNIYEKICKQIVNFSNDEVFVECAIDNNITEHICLYVVVAFCVIYDKKGCLWFKYNDIYAFLNLDSKIVDCSKKKINEILCDEVKQVNSYYMSNMDVLKLVNFAITQDSTKIYLINFDLWIKNLITSNKLKTQINYKYPKFELNIYDLKDVFYCGYVGNINNEHIYKYGITNDIIRRTKQHTRIVTTYEVIYVYECGDNKKSIEKLFKYYLKWLNLLRDYYFSSNHYVELFCENPNLSLTNIDKVMKLIEYTNKYVMFIAKFIIAYILFINSHDVVILALDYDNKMCILGYFVDNLDLYYTYLCTYTDYKVWKYNYSPCAVWLNFDIM